MKYIILILLVLNTLDVFSQNQSLPVLKMYKSDKSVTITPLTDIDSLVHVSIVPVTLTLLEAKNITNTSARLEATILSIGEGTLGQIGFCWSTAQNPTISANKVNGTWKDSINFSNTINSFTNNTKYYARAFAYNELGISYSNQIEFNSLNKQDSLLENVKIGAQIWQTKNLDVSKYKNGDSIRYARTRGEWMDAAEKQEGAWCYYDHEPLNGEIYGKLYNWYAVNDKRGLAPKGYHIPTDAEWTILTDYLGGEQTSGFKMKSTTGWKNNGNGNNISGFNGLPGGYCNNGGYFNGITGDEYFWSSSESSTDDAWNRGLNSYSLRVDRNHGNKSDGLYVRCIKD